MVAIIKKNIWLILILFLAIGLRMYRLDYLELFGEEYNKEGIKLSPETENILFNYPWPGNTEELKLTIERLVMAANTNIINANDLPLDFLVKTPGITGSDYFANFEKAYVAKITAAVGGDKTKLASLLGVSPALL